jgi:hypothetical protein
LCSPQEPLPKGFRNVLYDAQHLRGGYERGVHRHRVRFRVSGAIFHRSPATLTRAQSVLACRSSHCRQLCPLSTPSSSPHRRKQQIKGDGRGRRAPTQRGPALHPRSGQAEIIVCFTRWVPWSTHCTSTPRLRLGPGHVCFSGDFRESAQVPDRCTSNRHGAVGTGKQSHQAAAEQEEPAQDRLQQTLSH